MTHTGSAHTTRGAGRPAAAAAAVIVGAMWVPMVAGPVIQVAVPSAMRPVTLSIWVPSAATSTGTGGASGMSRASLAVSVSPSKSTASPRTRGRRMERYSRRWRTGFSQSMPSIPSMTSWWDRPMPSVNRPCDTCWRVSAWAASIIG